MPLLRQAQYRQELVEDSRCRLNLPWWRNPAKAGQVGRFKIKYIFYYLSRGGGIGIRAGLKIQWP